MDEYNVVTIYFKNGHMMKFEQVNSIRIDYHVQSSDILIFKYRYQNILHQVSFYVDQISGYSVADNIKQI